MDIRRALNTAREWSQGKGNPIFRFYIKQMMVDEAHKAEVISCVTEEIIWVERTIEKQKKGQQIVGQGAGYRYNQKDVEDLVNLLEVAKACPPGENVQVLEDFS